MSDALDNVAGLERIALFPLPLVLFPGEILPLHIFEEKYRQMLTDVSLGRNVFGVTYFEPTDGFTDRPPTGSVGCLAEIRDIVPADDGRSNIITSGVVRFRIVEYVEVGTPYLTAIVEFFEDESGNEEATEEAAASVFELFKRVAKAAYRLGGNRGELPELERSAPEPLSFLVSAAFSLENEQKYQFLAMRSTQQRLERLRSVLVRAVDVMEENADITKRSQTNGHSKKKIDH